MPDHTHDWRADVRARLAGAKLTPEDEAQIVEEVAQHLEEQFAELSAQGDPEIARARLLAELREETFDAVAVGRRRAAHAQRIERTELAGGAWRDIMRAARSLMRSPGVALPGIIALALGIGLTTAMFGEIYGLLLKGLPFHNADRIVSVHMLDAAHGVDDDALSFTDFTRYRERQRSLERFGGYYVGPANLTGGAEPERVGAARMTADIFDVTGVPPILGRVLAAADNDPASPTVAVIGGRLWRERFSGDTTILGRVISVNGRPATVVGVMPDSFDFPARTQLWLPIQVSAAAIAATGGPSVIVVGLLRPETTAENATADLRTIELDRSAASPDERNVRPLVQPFIRAYVRPQIYLLLYGMLAAVGLVLLVACANVSNLLLHRASNRMKEIGIHHALGASRAAIVRRALIESLLLSAVAAVLGALIAQGFVLEFNRSMPIGEVPFWSDVRLHWPVLAFVVALAVVAGLVGGLLPAIQSSRVDVAAVLKQDVYGTSALRVGRLSRAVIVVEIAVASALVLATGFVSKSIVLQRNVDPGVRTKGVITASVSLSTADTARRTRFFASLEQALAAAPGVQHAYVGSGIPVTGMGGARISVEGQTYERPRDHPSLRQLSVSPGFFETFGVRPVRGRVFTDGDRAGAEPVALVSQSFAARFKDGDPIGRRIRIEGRGGDSTRWLTIVGVVPTLYASSPDVTSWPAELFTSFAQDPSRSSVSVALAGTGDLAATLRSVARAAEPDAPVYDLATMDDVLHRAAWPMRAFGGSFVVFGVAALVLAAIGLYAVMAFSVTSRLRELGIRLALGATPRDVVRMVLTQAGITIAIGMTVGVVLGGVVTHGIRAALFDVSPNDPTVYAAVIGVLGASALAACIIPAARATALDPVDTLRSD